MALVYNDAGDLIDDGTPSLEGRAPLQIEVNKLPVDNSPYPINDSFDPTAFDVAASRLAKGVKHTNPLPVADDRNIASNFFGGPSNPERPSYIVEPNLEEAQGGMHLPESIYQDAGGGLFYRDTNEPVPIAPRFNALPLTFTPEGVRFATPKLLDVASNIMGNVGGKVLAKPGEMVLGSGRIKLIPVEGNPFIASEEARLSRGNDLGYNVDDTLYHGTTAKINFQNFKNGDGELGQGTYLTTDKNDPLLYFYSRGENGRILPVNVKKGDLFDFGKLKETQLVGDKTGSERAIDEVVKRFIENNKLGYKIGDEDLIIDNIKRAFERTGDINGILKEAGYIGGFSKSSQMSNQVVIFDPKNIKSKFAKFRKEGGLLLSDTRNQVTSQVAHQVEKNGFYSTLQTAVSNAKPSTATAEQWLGYLKNQPGVKAEEINHVLKNLPEGQISKAQLEDIIKQNKIELKETVLGDRVKETRDNYEKHAKTVEDAAGKLDDEIHKISGTTSFNFQGNKIYSDELSHGIFSGDIKPSELPKELQSVGKELADAFKAREAARYEMQQANNDRVLPVYHQYQLPGGENYKETLLKLPGADKVKVIEDSMNANAKKVQALRDEMKGTSGTDEIRKEIRRLQNENDILNTQRKEAQAGRYSAPHFHGQDAVDLLAHMRSNERTIPEAGFTLKNKKSGFKGKHYATEAEALADAKNYPESIRNNLKVVPSSQSIKGTHIEELQSDLHQATREHGYKGEAAKLESEFNKIEEKIMASGDEEAMGHPDLKEALKMMVDRKIINQQEANTYQRYVTASSGEGAGKSVPDLPFKKNWDELLIKKAIMDAVSKGHKFISVTPGEAQALRYQNEIRQQIDNIRWIPREGKNGERVVSIKPTSGSGNIYLDIDKNGKIMSGPSELKGKGLDEAIGKDLAKQILEKGEGTIDTKGYVMGAEGMKGYYDKMVIDKFNNIGKKYGAKMEPFGASIPKGEHVSSIEEYARRIGLPVESETIQREYPKSLARSSQPIHIFRITPELEKKAKEGFELFSGPGLVPVPGNPFKPNDDNKKPKLKFTPISYNPFTTKSPSIHEQMLQDRANSVIRTIDPGTHWDKDKNVILPENIAPSGQENI